MLVKIATGWQYTNSQSYLAMVRQRLDHVHLNEQVRDKFANILETFCFEVAKWRGGFGPRRAQ